MRISNFQKQIYNLNFFKEKIHKILGEIYEYFLLKFIEI